LRPDEGHVRVPFFVEICIDHNLHDGPGVGVEREFAVGVGLVLVESGPSPSGRQQYVISGTIFVLATLLGEHRQISVLAALPALPAEVSTVR